MCEWLDKGERTLKKCGIGGPAKVKQDMDELKVRGRARWKEKEGRERERREKLRLEKVMWGGSRYITSVFKDTSSVDYTQNGL